MLLMFYLDICSFYFVYLFDCLSQLLRCMKCHACCCFVCVYLNCCIYILCTANYVFHFICLIFVVSVSFSIL